MASESLFFLLVSFCSSTEGVFGEGIQAQHPGSRSHRREYISLFLFTFNLRQKFRYKLQFESLTQPRLTQVCDKPQTGGIDIDTDICTVDND